MGGTLEQILPRTSGGDQLCRHLDLRCLASVTKTIRLCCFRGPSFGVIRYSRWGTLRHLGPGARDPSDPTGHSDTWGQRPNWGPSPITPQASSDPVGGGSRPVSEAVHVGPAGSQRVPICSLPCNSPGVEKAGAAACAPGPHRACVRVVVSATILASLE